MQSYVHVYTGNGKGKSTAAFGLALRATGAGKKVLFSQFVKGQKYSEIHAIEKYLPTITVKQFGKGFFIYKNPTQADIDMAREGLKEIAEILKSGQYDVVVLDEANIAIYYKLISDQELINIIKERDPKTEVIITGRYATNKIIEFADLVTEMKEIKHYYKQGVEARKGIES